MFDVATHNGKITITSAKTGEHRIINISTVQSGPNSGKRRVSIKQVVGDSGKYNSSYNYPIFADVNDGRVELWRIFSHNAFFVHMADMVSNPQKYIDAGLATYQFEGRCRVCNQPLTNPESITSGIGPTCAKNNR